MVTLLSVSSSDRDIPNTRINNGLIQFFFLVSLIYTHYCLRDTDLNILFHTHILIEYLHSRKSNLVAEVLRRIIICRMYIKLYNIFL